LYKQRLITIEDGGIRAVVAEWCKEPVGFKSFKG
jgi:hypothetical protein